MHVERIGFTPVKGGRHTEHEYVDLTLDGPGGDRVFCLLDPARNRVLRTVEDPGLIRTVATWRAGVLTVDLPSGTVEGTPVPTGETRKVDYWGRVAELEIVDGGWAAGYSEHLGRPVLLARCRNPGDVVYGAAVSLVSTASMRELARRLGRTVHSARFRPTLLVATDGPPHVEDDWMGRELVLGDATVVVRAAIPRCAVVDVDPVTGDRDGRVLQTLAGYRRGDGGISFGVDAVVTTPGRVLRGDVCSPAVGGTPEQPIMRRRD